MKLQWGKGVSCPYASCQWEWKVSEIHRYIPTVCNTS